MNLPINEIFYSIQGEGTHIGKPMTFVRFAGCNLSCHFCDQPDSVPLSPIKLKVEKIPIEEVVKTIESFPTNIVCLTGGEPTLFEKEILDLMILLNKDVTKRRFEFHLETNGTHFNRVVTFCQHVSFAPHERYHPEIWEWATDIKIVMDENFERNLKEALCWTFKRNIWIQPLNDITSVNKNRLEDAINYVLQNPNLRLSPQLHKFLNVR